MTIRHAPINESTHNIYLTGYESIAAFKMMVRRALNVWPDAPPEIKEFGDLILEGKVLQDYVSQAQPMKKYQESGLPVLTGELYQCRRCEGWGYAHFGGCPRLGKTMEQCKALDIQDDIDNSPSPIPTP